MRRAKMMLKPKLGPIIKQAPGRQQQQQPPKTTENDAQISTIVETALMPLPPAPVHLEKREQPPPPVSVSRSIPPKSVTVEVSTRQIELELDKRTVPLEDAVVCISNRQKSDGAKQKPSKVAAPETEIATSPPVRRERKPTKKADEFRAMLMASRRKFGKVREPIDTSKLTMLDLIYYNPPGAPMKKKSTEPEKQVEKLEEQSLEPELEEESTAVDSSTSPKAATAAVAAEEEVMGPRVVVGPDGEIQIDETSLVIRRPNPLDSKHKLKVTVEEAGRARYDSFKTRKMKKCTWNAKETSKFYRALSICGTDFTLMSQFFPSRSRQDLKNKFKREEKSNPSLIDKAIHHPTQFEYTDIELEDIAKEDNEASPKPKTVRSGSKYPRKKKFKRAAPPRTEAEAVAKNSPEEKTSSLRVSRPKRLRKTEDQSAINENTRDSQDAANALQGMKEKNNEPQYGSGSAQVEKATETSINNGMSAGASLPTSPDGSENLRPSGSGAGKPSEISELSPPVIDEFSQTSAKTQPQSGSTTLGHANECLMTKDSTSNESWERSDVVPTKPQVLSRKIPAPVFKPRHRKVSVQTATKSLAPRASLLVVGLTTSEQVTEMSKNNGLDQETLSASTAQAQVGKTKAGPITSTGESEKLRLPMDISEKSADEHELRRSADSREQGLDVSSGGVSTDGKSFAKASSDLPASELSTKAGIAVEAQIKDIFREDFDKLRTTRGESESITPPKLVLPSRPTLSQIIRPIGAAKTRGVVLSPMTKRRSDTNE